MINRQGLPVSPWHAIISATPETAQHLKTMTLIEATNNGTFFTLTTEKGNTVEVSTSLGHVMVFIQRKGLKQLAKGRRFPPSLQLLSLTRPLMSKLRSTRLLRPDGLVGEPDAC